jgi:serine/threonine protein kinase
MEIHAGAVFNKRYKVIEKLGNPKKNNTFLAADLRNEDREVVVKILSIAGLESWKEYDLFTREAETLKTLDHECIPHYIDYFSEELGDEKCFFLVHEYMPGKNLEDIIRGNHRFTENEIIGIAKEMLEILVFLQKFRPPIIHRDINPRNLIMGKNGRISLVDFGAVQEAMTRGHYGTQTVVGTVGYMPLEQLMGRSVEATDLHAVGVTLVFLLTHTDPVNIPVTDMKLDFRGLTRISDGFFDFIDILIDPDVAKRYQTSSEALAALEAVGAGSNEKTIDGDTVRFIKEKPVVEPEWIPFIEDVRKRDGDLFDPRYRQ